MGQPLKYKGRVVGEVYEDSTVNVRFNDFGVLEDMVHSKDGAIVIGEGSSQQAMTYASFKSRYLGNETTVVLSGLSPLVLADRIQDDARRAKAQSTMSL